MRDALTRTLVLTALALASTAAAPPRSLPEWRADVARFEARLGEVEALEHATVRIHNRLAEEGLTARKAGCEDPRGLPRRAALLGRAWQERLVAAEATLATLEAQAASPLVAPLLDEGAPSLEAIVSRVARGRAHLDEAAAWARRHVPRCDRPLESGEGVAPPVDEDVAVIALGPGRLCPADARLPDGASVHVVQGETCVSVGGECTCTPVDVGPGAVLSGP